VHRKKRRGGRFWWGRPDGKRPLGTPKCRWEDNIKMDLQDVGWEDGEACTVLL